MAVTPKSRLEAAENRLDSIDEVDWRSAAHEAHYACLDLARKILDIEGFPIYADDGSHQAIINGLTNSKKTKLQSIGYRILQLKKIRVDADYYTNEDFPKSKAETAVEMARKIFAEVSDRYEI